MRVSTRARVALCLVQNARRPSTDRFHALLRLLDATFLQQTQGTAPGSSKGRSAMDHVGAGGRRRLRFTADPD